MIVEKKGWYRLELPEGWTGEEDEGALAVSHPESAGVLQMSVQDPPVPAGQRVDPYLMLRAFLKQSGVDFELSGPRRWSEDGLDWAACEYESEEEGEAVVWRAWMASDGDLVAFFTYGCPAEARDLERCAIDGIVATLRLG
jgi:hypothetical protein